MHALQGIQIMPRNYIIREGDTVFLIAEDDVPSKAMEHLKKMPESVDVLAGGASTRGERSRCVAAAHCCC